jgi:Flp pilus assembly protein TadG
MASIGLKRMASRLLCRCRDFARRDGAMAAVEFALLLPVMLVTYLGTVEAGGVITVDRKLANLALTLANLTARANNALQDTDINGIMNASAAVLSPYDSTAAGMVISSIVFDSSSPPNGYVVWSDAAGAGAVALTPSCKNNVSTTLVPNSVRTANGSVILAQAKYPYTPTIGYVLTGTFSLTENDIMVPRNLSSVPRTNSSGTTYSTCTGGKLS